MHILVLGKHTHSQRNANELQIIISSSVLVNSQVAHHNKKLKGEESIHALAAAAGCQGGARTLLFAQSCFPWFISPAIIIFKFLFLLLSANRDKKSRVSIHHRQQEQQAEEEITEKYLRKVWNDRLRGCSGRLGELISLSLSRLLAAAFSVGLRIVRITVHRECSTKYLLLT